MTRKTFRRVGTILLCILLVLCPGSALAEGDADQETKEKTVVEETVDSGEDLIPGEETTREPETETKQETTAGKKTSAEAEKTTGKETASSETQPATAVKESEPEAETSSEKQTEAETTEKTAEASEEQTETEKGSEAPESSGEKETEPPQETTASAGKKKRSTKKGTKADLKEKTTEAAKERESESETAEMTSPAGTDQTEPSGQEVHAAARLVEDGNDFSDVDTIENLDRTPMWHSEWLNTGSLFMLRMYQKIDAEQIMADEDTDVFMKDDFTSEKIARLEHGAIVYGLERTASDYIFVEAKDAEGRIVRGYVSARMMQVAPLGMEETAERIFYAAEGNFSYVDCMLTALDELEGKKVTTALRADLVNYALKWLGHPYVLGGNSLEKGIDCSGFCKKVYAMYNEEIPRLSRQQACVGRRISAYDAMPGDLLFHMRDGRVHHVMICISNDGNGHLMVVHARSRQYGILVNKMNAKNLCWGVTIFPREDEALEVCSVKNVKTTEAEVD